MTKTPRSDRFDDVYFSAQDGPGETEHVFLQGNNLPARWQENRDAPDRQGFVIAETGFGTGLNFLMAWKLFDETASPGAMLDFISVEKYPLSPAEIAQALSPWANRLAPFLDKLIRQYPMRVPGFHRMVFDGRVALTLIFGDANEVLADIEAAVDCWFLDGFTPAKNPDMWTDKVFAEMARLSKPGASFATFTAAGFVKRGLMEAGFSVEKKRGFGRKRDMLAGRYQDSPAAGRAIASAPPRGIGIVGAGLAGCALAQVLPQYGFTVTLYEKEAVAAGASGNPLGLLNPRFSTFREAESDFYTAAFALAERSLRTQPADYRRCGALHFIDSEEKNRKLVRTAQNWGWHQDHMRLVSAGEASAIAGLTLSCAALCLPDSAVVSPLALCNYYAKDAEIVVSPAPPDIKSLNHEAVILACGPGFSDYESLTNLPLHTVRGQLTLASATPETARLQTSLCYGGYISPAIGGAHAIGSTFQKWLSGTDKRPEDNADNIAKLMAAVELSAAPGIIGSRAALRVSARDRFPVVGKLEQSLYVSTAHGSHGLISSLMAAHLLADYLRTGPLCLSRAAAAKLSPQRFGVNLRNGWR